MIVTEPQELLKRWAAHQLGPGHQCYVSGFGVSYAIGVVHRDELLAVAIYNNFVPPNIEVTFVTSSPRWASPQAVRAIIGYPFLQLGCKRITAVTGATNQPARAFLCRLGFREEGVHPDALPSGDAVTYGLLRKDAARWLAEEKTIRESARSGHSAPKFFQSPQPGHRAAA